MEDNKYTPEEFTCLPRDELCRILAEELHKPTTEIDDALVRKLMAELHSKGADPSFADDAAVETACGKFREDSKMAQSPQKHWYQSWMIKVASIVLGFGILFFALPGAAQADEISEVLSWWSDSAFQFFKPSEKIETQSHSYKTDHTGLQQVYDAVTELGIIDPIVPTWVPKGFELTELNSYPALGSTMIFALFSREEFEILITFPQII